MGRGWIQMSATLFEDLLRTPDGLKIRSIEYRPGIDSWYIYYEGITAPKAPEGAESPRGEASITEDGRMQIRWPL